MRSPLHRWFLILLVWTLSAVPLRGQIAHTPSKERVDPTLRRRTEIDGNNVRTSVFNFVFSGRTGAGQGVPYEWPKNTNRLYIALIALFIGGEVHQEVNGVDSLMRIVDLPAYRQNPSTGGDWNMGPIPGYFNPAVGKLAKSDEPDTWPSTWPDKRNDPNDPGWRGSWNGYFGKNQFNADQEMYYRAGDDNYNRWPYVPDTTDPSRRGLGMIVDVRAMQWSQASVADAVFFIQEIKNDGTKDIKKTGVTLWLADFVGGDGDSQDDSPSFDLIQDIAFSLDADGKSSNPAFQGAFVGAAATLYLETPGNATDRIDNDGDSPEYFAGPKVTGDMFASKISGTTTEITGNQVDENKNGLIDEDSTYIPFGAQRGVGYADGIDNDDNGEAQSPVVTDKMVSEASLDPWKRWPPNPEQDAFQQGEIYLIDVGTEDVGKRYADLIDNNDDSHQNLPRVTQTMIDQALTDKYHRYRVPGTQVILYDLGPEDLGKKYANINGQKIEGVDEKIDEMVDESRNDGIDNDGDWNPVADDVGLDGAANTGDEGERDGRPTSGIGTPFPGEPNVDKTDVSEADQIGLTNVQYLAAGAINFSTTSDITFWASFMLPGSFVDPSLIPTGESDLFVSSGVFPMKAGQIERISYAVVFGSAVRAGNARLSGAYDDALRKREFAQLAYNEDYQFAQAPVEPTVHAVVGNGRVTLTWDDRAERSIDRFLAGIPGAQSRDFEGYRIYRATDPAFEDARVITDGYGSPAPFLKPIAQFDLKDGIKGFDSVAFSGTFFDMGNDIGIVHTWTDSSVQNGKKYYYAVRAYDQGYTPLRIFPSESNLKINMDNVTGAVLSHGPSVVIVTPEFPAAGYLPPSVSKIERVAGGTTGVIGYKVVVPDSIRDNHKYRITFEDTVLIGRSNAPDTFQTKSFTLADITNSSRFDTLVSKSRRLADTLEQPIVNGFQLTIHNENFFGVNRQLSGWNRLGVENYDFKQWKSGFTKGQQKPSDYKVVFGPLGMDTSTAGVYDSRRPPAPAIPVNFKVYNSLENKQLEFIFFENDTEHGPDSAHGPGYFSSARSGVNLVTDYIILLERDSRDSLAITWGVNLGFDSLLTMPEAGDTLTLVLSKLFRKEDVFEFTTTAQRIDRATAKADLEKIKVVPNPYVAAATWEEKNPYTSGRGPRAIHFNHLPQVCTIRIFTVSGELVTTLYHDAPMNDGTEAWNLLTRDNLSAAYGVYIYHIDAPGVGEKVGKFAIIK